VTKIRFAVGFSVSAGPGSVLIVTEVDFYRHGADFPSEENRAGRPRLALQVAHHVNMEGIAGFCTV